MLDAFSLAFWRGVELTLILLPLALLAKEKKFFFQFLSLLGFFTGFSLLHLPFLQRFSLKLWILKGEVLFAGSFLILAAISAFGLQKLLEESTKFKLIFFSLLSFFLFPLEGLELSNQLNQVVFLKESSLPYLFALLGGAASLIFYLLFKRAFNFLPEKVFSLWNFFLFCVGVKFIWEPFIIPSLEVLVARITHDFVHYLVVLILTPDHPYLTTPFWSLIAVLFRKTTSLVLNVITFFFLSIFLLVYTFTRPFPHLPGLKAPQRRKVWAEVRRKRWLQSIPVFLSLLIFSALVFQAYASEASLYEPTPEPLTISGGEGRIKLGDLNDGRLHKYSTTQGNEEIRIIAIKKPDNSYAVCLDACLICPPDGYAQLQKDLFCLYCGTPIPINTVGEPGGCNPVPISFEEKGGSLSFDVEKAIETWKEVNKGK